MKKLDFELNEDPAQFTFMEVDESAFEYCKAQHKVNNTICKISPTASKNSAKFQHHLFI